MPTVKFNVDNFVRTWQAMQKRMDAEGRKGWEEVAFEAREAQKGFGYTKRTGELDRSMRAPKTWQRGAFGWRTDLVTDAPYARYVDKGTRPHVIRAKGGGMLRFYWPKVGAWVQFKQVNHPGFKGAGFRAAAIQTFEQHAAIEVERALARAASK